MSGEREAGRELDCEVAERVFGWKPIQVNVGTPYEVTMHVPPDEKYLPHKGRTPPAFNTSIADAWLVVEKMRETHNCLLTLEQILNGSDDCENWHAVFTHRETDEEWAPVSFFNPTPAPHAICLAALQAMEGGK